MKKLILLSVLFTFHQNLFAQNNFEYSLGENDIRVWLDYRSKSKPTFQIQSSIRRDTLRMNSDTWYMGMEMIISPNVNYNWLAKDSNGHIIRMVSNRYKIEELFPLQVAIRDTFILRTFQLSPFSIQDSSRCIIQRRFDTTLFGKTVSAYQMLRMNRSDTFQIVVADTFGLIEERTWDKINQRFGNPMVLNSAVLNGISYNRDHRRVRLMSLCTGNEYQFRHDIHIKQGPQGTWNRLYKMIDTLIGNTKYYRIGIFGNRYLRESNSGIVAYQDSIQMYLPDDLSIGSCIKQHKIVVTDTLTVNLSPNEQRLKFIAEGPKLELENFWEILSPYGIIVHHYSSPFFIFTDYSDLLYAKICDREYGKLNDIDDSPDQFPSSFVLKQNYPNPFAEETRIDLTPALSYAERELRVFDLFGREVLDLSEQARHSSEIVIHRSQLPRAGVFFYRLKTANRVYTRAMLCQ